MKRDARITHCEIAHSKKNENKIMKKLILSALALVSLAGAAKADDKVLMTIDGDPVMQSDFMYIYEKNNQETTVDQKTIDEYLDLFVNFKLKVKEAEAQGIDTTADFKKELASYRKQALPKYMQDKELEDQMVRLSYEHMRIGRRVAHIAIECPSYSSDSATEAALAQINDARVRVTTGKETLTKKGKKVIKTISPKEDFYTVALEVSTDPGVQETRGEIGWVPPFRYFWSFEKAAYETALGEVSEVFRTPYGFHILLVEEERPYQEVHASHIMKMCNTQIDSVSLPQKAELTGIWQLAKDGGDFAELAKQHSEDKGSAVRGGDLGWFGRGRMVQPFEDIAFSMEPGEISEPFATRFGWHFIKLHEKRGIQPLDSIYEQVQKQVQRDERHQEVDKAYVEKLRKEHNLPASASREEVMAAEEASLEGKFPEFKHLMQEYHDGILLFDVSLKEVWDKATLDTAGIEAFFAQNKKNYTWDEPRYKGIVFSCKDQNTMKAVKRMVKSANPDSLQSYIDKRMNVDSIVYVRSEKALWKKGQNKAVDKLVWKEGDFQASEEFPYVFVVGKKLKNPEVYMDERGKVTSDYQDYLEKQWIEELKKKHEVVINRGAFEELKK